MLDILQAIERIDAVVSNITLIEFEADWQSQWLVERGIQIISEASRHLTQEMKSQFPQIPWRKVADIGNVLRHDYGNVAAPILWKLAQDDLPVLEQVCRKALASMQD